MSPAAGDFAAALIGVRLTRRIRGSSVVEHLAQDRVGAGSTPAPGPNICGSFVSNHSKIGKGSVNPGYARDQLAKALTAVETGDPGARDRVRKWQQVFAAILDGSLEYGSRAPIANVPVWATPEVVTGGFVTGNLLAAGPLQAHEQSRLGDDHSVTTPRTALNAGYLSSEGHERRNRLRDAPLASRGARCRSF